MTEWLVRHGLVRAGLIRPWLAWIGFASAVLHAQAPIALQPADRRAEAVVAERPGDTASAMKRLVLPTGLAAQLWAGEPMLANPTAIAFDEKGRLFVAETHRYRTSALDVRDYPQLWERDLGSRTPEDRARLLESAFGGQTSALAVESERIRMLEDANGDGSAERSRLVAEGFNSAATGTAAGILARDGQLWVAAPPSLVRLRLDASGAAGREEILRGFGTHIGFAGHDLHGFAIGPDAKLYFSIGDRGARIAARDGKAVDVPDTGAILRSNLDGSGLEIVATGLRNPRGLAFDDYGNLFTADGEAGGGSRARFVHVIEGGDSGWRTGYQEAGSGSAGPWSREELWRPAFKEQAAYVLPPVAGIEPGAAGLAYFPGTGLLPEARGRFFVAHWNQGPADSGLKAYALGPAGAGFVLEGAQDITGGAMPTDVAFGPDGRLYFSDWVSGWPWPKSGRGRIYAVAASNATAAERAAAEQTRRLIADGLERHSLAALAELLGHADQRVRLNAQFELARRGDPALAAFEGVAGNSAAPRLARVHAIWGLGQLAARLPTALNRYPALIADKDPEIRAQTARMLGDHLRIEGFRALRTALEDPEPRVVFFAAQSLGKLRHNGAIPALLEALRRNDDRDVVLRHAIVVALARLGADPALAATVNDRSRAVRVGGLLAYRRLEDPAVADYLQDFDSSVVREAARAIHDVPIAGALPALAALLDFAPLDDDALVTRVLNAHFRLGQPENAAALAAFAGRPYVPASFRAEALRYLSLWAAPPARDRVTGQPANLPAREPEPARKAVVEFLTQQAGRTPEEVQIAALQAVAELNITGTGHALWDVVYQETRPVASRVAALRALEKKNDLRLEVAAMHSARSDRIELRLAALPILARRPPPVSLPLLTAMARTGTPAELQLLFPIVGSFDDPRADELLAAAVRRLAEGDVPLAAQAELLDATLRRQTPQTAAAIKQLQEGWAAGPDRLAPYRSALAAGDVAAGRWLFTRHPGLACLQCHEVERADAGPSLANIGALRSKENLLESVVRPEASVSPGYSSSMPEGVGEVLSRRELRDLIAYLSDLRGDAGPKP